MLKSTTNSVQTAINHLECNQPASAKKILARLINTSPQDLQLLKLLGYSELRLGNLSAAVEYFSKFTSQKLDDLEVNYFLGCCFFDLKKYDQAIPCFDSCVKQKADFIDAYYFLGVSYIHLKNLDKAHLALTHVLLLNPIHINALIHLANIEKQMGNVEEAIQYYNLLLQNSPNRLEFYFPYCQCLVLKKDLLKIQEIIDRLQRLDQNTYNIQFDIITNLMQTGFNQEAFELYSNMLKKYGESPLLLNNMGAALDNLGNREQAITHFKNALRKDPNYTSALNNIARVLTESNRFEEAHKYLEKALTLAPDNVNININFGRLMELNNNFKQALQFYKTAEQNETTGNPLLNYNIGNLYHTLGKYELSTKYFKQCLSIDSNYADAEFNLGMNELELGDFEHGWGHYFKRIRNINADVTLSPITPGMRMDNKRICFFSSQGIGDEIFFMRFLPQIKQQHHNVNISYRPSEKTYDLLINTPEIDLLLTDECEIPQSDYYFAIDDIALLLNMDDVSKIPPPLRLTPDLEITKKYSLIMKKYPRPHIGVAWRAGTETTEYHSRNNQRFLSKNIPLETLVEIAESLKGTIFIIQRNPHPGEVEMLQQTLQQPVIDMTGLNESLLEMQALLGLLDDYIGISNTNIHLLASQNKHGKVLVPSPPEWRWMSEGNHSPWMPNFTIYRQDKNRDWGKAISRLRNDLFHQ